MNTPTLRTSPQPRLEQRRRPDALSRALAAFCTELGLPDSKPVRGVLQRLRAELPDASTPSEAVAYARHRLDTWLGSLGQSLSPPLLVTPHMGRAALLAMDIGRQWPEAFLSKTPSARFLAAFQRMLPVAYPPESRLSMPEQSLQEWSNGHLQAVPAYSLGVWLRRPVVLGLGVVSTILAECELYRVVEPGGITPVEIVLMVLFVLNFFWIATTFWSALVGLIALWNRWQTPGLVQPPTATGPLSSRTAVLMPVYNEQPGRVFATLEAIYTSVQSTGQLNAFDFFVLSDSTDPDAWVAEELAWDTSRRRLDATGRLFYRHRPLNTARKAGNIAEFCQRWGGRYEHIVILDADSVMTGETLVRLACLMETNPELGLLQTVPVIVNAQTLFARMQQFAGRLYGPVFAAGLAFWHLGEGNYWGHNAILRVRAFVENAGLPCLTGKAPFGGHILSHDFVEAALIRRGGWQVSMLADIEGSYEECPPSLIDHAQRDRRWCQGNLQHLAVLGAKGLHPVSRLHLLTGIMSYLSSPVWLAFLLVGILAALQSHFQLPVYFFPEQTPYPVWHVIDPVLATRLFGITMGVLLAPKVFGWLLLLKQPQRAVQFGGLLRTAGGVIAETLFSTLMAPVMMLFQSRFVVEVLLGRDSGWKTQTRDGDGVPWSEVFRCHRVHTFVGCSLAGAVYVVYPTLLIWMSPVIAGLLLAMPVSYGGGRLSLGLLARRLGVLITPEETDTPAILADAAQRRPAQAQPASSAGTGLLTAVSDQRAGALHLALLSQAPALRNDADLLIARQRVRSARAVADLLICLDPKLQLTVLGDRQTLAKLRRSHGKRARRGA